MRAGHVARIGENMTAYRLLVGKPRGKIRLGGPRSRWVDNIKTDLGDTGRGDIDWIDLVLDRGT
jgi:hypothetical protein